MRRITTAASLAAALVTAGSTLGAQVNAQASSGPPISYTTTGKFTSPGATCNQTVSASTAVCSGAGFTLTFTGTTGANIGSGSITSLGQFLLAGTGNASTGPGVVNFQLDVLQTAPTTGTGSFLGSIFGSVSTTNGNFSSLEWDPTQRLSIGPVNYTLVFDNIGPATDRGIGIPINNQRGINALVTSVPEPSTYAMLGMGLTGLLAAARRRRNTTG